MTPRASAAHDQVSVPLRFDRDELLRDVRDTLSRRQKELNPKYFYDARGSRLFDEITRLPEYYLTNAERRLLERCARELVREYAVRSLVELGAGSADKTRILLHAMCAEHTGKLYVPIDVSRAFLESVASELREEYPELIIAPAVADITSDFPIPATVPTTMIAFLGSTIGNFGRDSAVSLLARFTKHLGKRDAFLLGVDLRKEVAQLEAAYNDSRGITAEFNRNILRVLNEQLGADFQPRSFDHRAFYNRELHRIEMHLVSRSDQTTTIPGIGEIHLREDESIRTEVSYKYDRVAVEDLFTAAGLRLQRWITDDAGLFALALGESATA